MGAGASSECACAGGFASRKLCHCQIHEGARSARVSFGGAAIVGVGTVALEQIASLH